jgi:hypothetical protein
MCGAYFMGKRRVKLRSQRKGSRCHPRQIIEKSAPE